RIGGRVSAARHADSDLARPGRHLAGAAVARSLGAELDAERERVDGPVSSVSSAVWITGPAASGTSALARAAAAELAAAGEPVLVLDLDEIRQGVTPSPSYTDTECDVVYRALVYMASALTAARAPVIVDATAHRRAWRDLARQRILRFAEVQLICPLEERHEREARHAGGPATHGMCARAGLPGSVVPGVDVPYEPAVQPELTIDPRQESRETAVRKIVELVRK